MDLHMNLNFLWKRLKEKKMTNADRIRAMSDEELALLIMCPTEYDLGFSKECECNNEMNRNCCRCTLKWLRSEIE